MDQTTPKQNMEKRPPVVVVMGHIDHGKSTLLDYIRKTNIVAKEAGGITQHMAAYEFVHETKDGLKSKITFIDTPGHEAFVAIRSRGAKIADVAILIVSAEDGVKPQTLDALKAIKESNTPFLIAINKIDRPNANIERTKQSLAENELYIEEWGGKIPCVNISAKTGEGVDELLDMVILISDMGEHTADSTVKADGYVLESHMHKSTGISATLVIKNGVLNIGDYLVSGTAYSPVRNIESTIGKKMPQATFSSPVIITGWTELPKAGETFLTVNSKKEAEKMIEENLLLVKKCVEAKDEETTKEIVPLIIKGDVFGTCDAILHEISKLNNDRIGAKCLYFGVGDITENDVKLAIGKSGTVILGFNVKLDSQARAIKEREGIEVKTFSIIYELSDYLKSLFEARTPKIDVEEIKGEIKILKFFSSMKNKQVVGGRGVSGSVHVKADVKIMRGEKEIGRGKILEMQQAKEKVPEVEAGKECGMQIESEVELHPGDIIQSFTIVKK